MCAVVLVDICFVIIIICYYLQSLVSKTIGQSDTEYKQTSDRTSGESVLYGSYKV